MRAVFRFSETGSARWISHLDLMRAMARAVRRAGLPAQYTQGFHPHISMSFAQALGVGYLSVGEYMEMDMEDGVNLTQGMDALNAALPECVRITGVGTIRGEAPTLMASVSAARWLIELDEPVGEALAKFRALLDRDTIEVTKEGKNGPSRMDIRPGILEIEPASQPIEPSPQPLPQVGGGESLNNMGTGAEPRLSNIPLPQVGGGDGERVAGGISLLLAAGSKLNVRPELVVRAALGEGAQARAITRLELYTTVNERLTPIVKICDSGEFDER